MPQNSQRRSMFGGTIQYRAETPRPESRRIEGYAILFDTESVPFEDSATRRVVEVVDPAAVTRALLDASDIIMTYDHDPRLILARSVNGEGTLSYGIDARGVSFAFDAPHTSTGDMVLEHIRRGDLRGCSFCFSADYDNHDDVSVELRRLPDGREQVTVRIRAFTGIYDFSITPKPRYDATSVETRAADVIARRISATANARASSDARRRLTNLANRIY